MMGMYRKCKKYIYIHLSFLRYKINIIHYCNLCIKSNQNFVNSNLKAIWLNLIEVPHVWLNFSEMEQFQDIRLIHDADPALADISLQRCKAQNWIAHIPRATKWHTNVKHLSPMQKLLKSLIVL